MLFLESFTSYLFIRALALKEYVSLPDSVQANYYRMWVQGAAALPKLGIFLSKRIYPRGYLLGYRTRQCTSYMRMFSHEWSGLPLPLTLSDIYPNKMNLADGGLVRIKLYASCISRSLALHCGLHVRLLTKKSRGYLFKPTCRSCPQVRGRC